MMMAAELGSTEAEEISLFQRLSEGNGRKPPRLEPWPSDICEQLEVWTEPLTWKLIADEVVLPGSGFWTVIENVPALAALPEAESCVDETKVVERAEPLRRTCAPETKLVPVTEREKLPRLVEEGEMPVSVGEGLRRVTALEEDLEVSAALMAVTEIVFGEGRTAGAVYFPEASMVPRVEEPPGVVLTDQATEMLVEPVTAAEKEYVEPARMLAEVGETVTLTVATGGGGAGGGTMVLEVVPQEARARAAKKMNVDREMRRDAVAIVKIVSR